MSMCRVFSCAVGRVTIQSNEKQIISCHFFLVIVVTFYPTASDCFGLVCSLRDFLGGTGRKEPACQHRRHERRGFSPWVRKISWRREKGNPPQYSCLENSMDRGAWRAIVRGVTENWTWLNWQHACMFLEKELPDSLSQEPWLSVLIYFWLALF